MKSPKTTSWLTALIMDGAWQVDTLAGGVEAIILSLTSRAAGWVACIPTILLTSRSCKTIFALTPMEALASAIALELVGQSTTKTWLRGREWNRSKRETDPPANAGLALALTIGYFAIDFVLIAILQIPKALGNPVYYAALLFPLAQVISTVITAERATQFGREAVRTQDKAKRREAAAKGKAKRDQSGVAHSNHSGNGRERSRTVSGNGHRSFAEFERALTSGELDVSTLTGYQIGQWAGKSAVTGRRWKRLATTVEQLA